MSEEIKKDIEQQPTTQPTLPPPGSGKMFTQDEVNKIVSDRLARDRKERSIQQQEDARELALKAKESMLDCREYLRENKYPGELLEVFDTSDVEKFKAAVEKLQAIYKRPYFEKPPQFTAPQKGSHIFAQSDPIRDAFKPKA